MIHLPTIQAPTIQDALGMNGHADDVRFASAAAGVPDASRDKLHIAPNAAEMPALLAAWLPKVEVGGQITGSGYGRGEVRASIDNFFSERGLRVDVDAHKDPDAWSVTVKPALGTEAWWKAERHTFRRDYFVDADAETGKPVLHLNFIPWGGLGDILMGTGAMGALWERFPDILFDCYAGRYLEVLDGLPFVRGIYNRWPPEKPVHMQTWGDTADGPRGTLATLYYALNVDDVPVAARRMRYAITDDERERGRLYLQRAGWRGGPVLGVQSHGGWRSKRWGNLHAYIALAQKAGLEVAVTGQAGDSPDFSDAPGVLNLCGQLPDVRALGGVLSHLSGWTGFDSGASYLAGAVGIPLVALFATHDAERMIGSAGAAGPVDWIWPNKMRQCQAEFGTNCRTDLVNAYWGTTGESCPLRHGEPGANCLDEITPEQVLAKMLPMVRPPQVIDTVGPFGEKGI